MLIHRRFYRASSGHLAKSRAGLRILCGEESEALPSRIGGACPIRTDKRVKVLQTRPH
jgi:hypothetical protein